MYDTGGMFAKGYKCVPISSSSGVHSCEWGAQLRATMTKVLLVEDNEMNRDMLSRRLIRRGFQVVFAMDGQQGIDLARSEHPDIILMDMGLPVVDGWEATRRVKADDATRSVPVIGLTAHAMSGDREKTIEAGCDDYETKPVEFDRLIGKIERLLGAAKF
jgi:two-component system, cell cycle response regulator DivK